MHHEAAEYADASAQHEHRLRTLLDALIMAANEDDGPELTSAIRELIEKVRVTLVEQRLATRPLAS